MTDQIFVAQMFEVKIVEIRYAEEQIINSFCKECLDICIPQGLLQGLAP